MSFKILVLSVLVAGAWCELVLPPGFKFGAATSAYQNEGAWNVSDKSENIWDRYFHENTEIGNADVTTDSYHKWRRDVEVAVELGLQFYRFSISWSRLLPTGYPDHISEDGRRYYSDLIDELLKNGIQPVVTIHHFDIPQSIHELGDWSNPEIVDWFADYSRVVFSLYADRVKTWLTINEPILVCTLIGELVNSENTDSYLCSKHILLAHAKAWRIYDQEFKSQYHGEVSIVNQMTWYEADTGTDEEVYLAELTMQLSGGLYSNPIYSEKGGWPNSIRKLIAGNYEAGLSQSKLPEFTEEEIDLVRGTFDFYALNYYTSRVVRKAEPGEDIGSWPFDGSLELDAVFDVRPDWEATVTDFTIYPEGLRQVLLWLKNNYGDIKFLITENGYPTNDTSLVDDKRIQSIHDHLEKVVQAVNEGVNVEGFTTWSMIDTFEFTTGYENHFGLFMVNFTDPSLPRIPRKSAEYYRQLTDGVRLGDC